MPKWQPVQAELSPAAFIAELDAIERQAVENERAIAADRRFSLARRRIAARNVAAFEARAHG
jgi:hypothetical protein